MKVKGKDLVARLRLFSKVKLDVNSFFTRNVGLKMT